MFDDQGLLTFALGIVLLALLLLGLGLTYRRRRPDLLEEHLAASTIERFQTQAGNFNRFDDPLPPDAHASIEKGLCPDCGAEEAIEIVRYSTTDDSIYVKCRHCGSRLRVGIFGGRCIMVGRDPDLLKESGGA